LLLACASCATAADLYATLGLSMDASEKEVRACAAAAPPER
jgi:hypothetical protein